MGIREFQYGNRGSQHGQSQCSPGVHGGSSRNTQVSWAGREWIRCRLYRFRLSVEEMNDATRMVERHTRLQ
jgi:hypothetical protein